MRKTRSTALLLSLALAVLSAACDDDSDEKPSEDAATPDTEPDASDETPDAGPEQEPDCFEDPRTHFEIINACTEAEKVEKDPELPLLLPDGGLPALP